MDIENLAFIVTDECNYRCGYCPQIRSTQRLDIDTAKRAVDLFFPHLKNKASVYFYGGEPLLRFQFIRELIAYIDEKNDMGKKIEFQLSTNGSLLGEEELAFLSQQRFTIQLSFDGTVHQINRSETDYEDMVALIKKMNGDSRLKFETNSVFTPATVGALSTSLSLLLRFGVKRIRISLSKIEPWGADSLAVYREEMSKVVDITIDYFRRTGTVPVIGFSIPDVLHNNASSVESDVFKAVTIPFGGTAVFSCTAGRDRLAIGPDGMVWGCFLFHDYRRAVNRIEEIETTYCLGAVNEFDGFRNQQYEAVVKKYAGLRMDNFFSTETDCFLCPDVFYCSVCPISAAYATGEIGSIPGWFCHITRIKKESQEEFVHKVLTQTNEK